MISWIRGHSALFFWLGGVSFFLFVGSLITIPILVAKIPADYFKMRRLKKMTQRITRKHPFHFVFRMGIKLLKNGLGVIFVLVGIAMLVLPGQGIITILLGLMLIDFPGKQNLEEKIIRKPTVLKTINWMREKTSQPPLEFLEEQEVEKEV